MSRTLFRAQAVQARRDERLGRISLVQPLRLWLLGVAVAVAAVLILLVLALGEYTRRSRVSGELVPDLGLSSVLAPGDGVVGRIFPQEGDEVGVGAELALITVPRVTGEGSDTLSVIRSGIAQRGESLLELQRSQLAQLDAQAAGQRQQLSAARRELEQIEAEVGTRKAQVDLGRETLQRYRRIANDRYVSQIQVNQQEQAVLELVQAQQALQRQTTTIRRTVAQLEQSLHELPSRRDALQAATQRDLALLAQERVQQEAGGELLLRAPLGGLIASRAVEPGQAVKSGQIVLTLLPHHSRLQAQLSVPSRAIGFVEIGDRVLLRYQAYPYQKFGHHAGTVVRVSRSPVARGSAEAAPADSYYRVLVDLDAQSVSAYGKPEALRPGMMLDADILGERRRLYEWVLEPLYSLSGRVGD
ncbi:membrane fusion protein [Tahibacter aquaticus]|uniref:Membrane fusion protein n=1 Tax=Tahibacter aquaticus TaxID=520092 RepID=A0A4R6YRR4_9GAMM|nr:HlyD family efflux transporter periplasmic adaptor subunit [Tahibacter aquaticus]TDR40754.1 membrane fusion protein [Tahibacter aquaticus]